jgi:FtsP/CotA-like multicopper oxidase with cupredoxin domain
MRTNNFKKILRSAVRVVSILPFAAVVAFGQQQVNLTAAPGTATMSDGTAVPMWGYSCGAAVSGSSATCTKLNLAAAGWSPVVITIPRTATGGLKINLTNNLVFGANSIPTSLVIVGQLGGGLGTSATSTPSPTHPVQNLTWPASGNDATNTPPPQGPRVQSFSTEVAGSATTALTWANLRPGTYLLESGTHPSIQGPMGLYGMLVVTEAAGTAYPGVTYAADINLLMSEIDPVQNKSVDAAVNTAGFSETMVWSGQPGGCGNPSSATFNQCYPPAVNYTPLYYMINGVAFDKTNSTASLFPTSPATGIAADARVLVRLVNAGLRMHVPSIVGSKTGTVSGVSLIAEDGNVLPGTPRIQNQVFMAAGKTYDVLLSAPAAAGTALPIFDRQGSMSANGTSREAGMLAYISINGAGLPAAPVLTSAVAKEDNYNSVVSGQTVTVSDPGKGVIANDVNVYGVKLVGTPVGGTVTLNTDGTFTFAATAASGSFQYCGNGATSGPACALVTLGAAAIESAGGILLGNDTYTSTVATALSIKSPGVLANDKDGAGYPLTVATPLVSVQSGLTVTVDSTGAFNASVAVPGTYTFSYKAKNSQGTLSAAAATVTLIFPAPSNLAVTLKDSKTKAALPADYRWIIEEDRTFYVDPAAQTNNAGAPGSTTVPVFGTNFHTSYMPVVAAGCVGTISCETGQSVLGVPAVCDVGNGACRTDAPAKASVLPSQVHLDPLKRYYISILPGDGLGIDQNGNDLHYCSTDTTVTCSHHISGAVSAPARESLRICLPGRQPSERRTGYRRRCRRSRSE